MDEQSRSTAGKSREEIFLELARLSEQSIEKRKDVEWKVNIAFWTGIGVFTWFGVQYLCPLSCLSQVVLPLVYFFGLVVWILGWQVPLHGAHQTDRDLKHYYADIAENRDEKRRRPTDEECKATLVNYWRKSWPQPWFWGQVLMTVIFLILSLLILYLSNGCKKPSQEDNLNVSGENLKAVVKKLTQ